MAHKRYLHLPLTYHWYDEIESGRKSIDYREQSEHWKSRIEGNTFDGVVLSRAYSGERMVKKWIKTEKLNSGIDTDLAVSGPVYAIYFE
jgi:hypothetical protein